MVEMKHKRYIISIRITINPILLKKGELFVGLNALISESNAPI